jgi:hypothetical protein
MPVVRLAAAVGPVICGIIITRNSAALLERLRQQVLAQDIAGGVARYLE